MSDYGDLGASDPGSIAPHTLSTADETGDSDVADDYPLPAWGAVASVLDDLQRQEHHWPVGRIMFQALIYFATQAGIPTGLDFQRGNRRPFAPLLECHLGSLQNSGVVVERQAGKIPEIRIGPTYHAAISRYHDCLEQWRADVDRTVDLMARMDTKTAEVAITVHFTARILTEEYGRRPTATEVITSVEQWTPNVGRNDIVDALAVLGLRGWLDVELDAKAAEMLDALIDS
ncbi:hypothetical protein ACWDTP_16150 [Mycobacterium sp. NPDC003449]